MSSDAAHTAMTGVRGDIATVAHTSHGGVHDSTHSTEDMAMLIERVNRLSQELATAKAKLRAMETSRGGANDQMASVAAPASLADAQQAIPRLPNHLVVTHILRSEFFDDPADLARLAAVSRAMRDVVAATGLRLRELELPQHRATQLGRLSVLKRLQRRGHLTCEEYLCQAAARSGQLEELKALRADGWPWNEYTCAAAAKVGHLEMLQWARANGCPWDKWACAGAAGDGHLEVLQWARANGCPWNERTCAYAAKGGHLEVLQWVRANGCPWDVDTIARAREYGHDDVVIWAKTNGAPDESDDSDE